ncbi:MAG: hypothetical protein LBI28_10155 [Treponema sp.]|jgi:hypothetical protein|nr:hypothetical protein [Treponema sp.]
MKKPAKINKTSEKRLNLKIAGILLFLAFAVFFGSAQVYAQRAPIDVNLIIDGSSSLTGVKDEVTTWLFARLDQILVNGDRVTVWNAGTRASVIYTGTIEGNAKDTLKRSIRESSQSGNVADFSGALREAASRQSSPYSYTLLISASPAALSAVISSPNASLLRFSRVEEFSTWRALVIGLNIDSRVRRASEAFFAQ